MADKVVGGCLPGKRVGVVLAPFVLEDGGEGRWGR